MTMAPALRKLTLTLHVIVSVGWLGAVAGFLALAVAGVRSPDVPTMRAVYPAMALMTWSVIVPLCLASLLTGVIQSLGTKWGLFRHYWVVAKLLITVTATVLLFVHTQPIAGLASAAEAMNSTADYRPVRVRLVVDAAAALFALIASTALAIYKPGGVTPYGRRRRQRPLPSKS